MNKYIENLKIISDNIQRWNSSFYEGNEFKSYFDNYLELLESLPKCLGDCLGGSGAHTTWANNCDRIATWNDNDADCAYPFPQCDEHFKQITNDGWLKYFIETPYADVIRKLGL